MTNIRNGSRLFTGRCDLEVISIMFETTEAKIAPQNQTRTQDSELPQMLWTYVSPFLFLAGLTGNILSLIVLNRPVIRRSSISLALRLIAFFDCIILVLGLSRHWTKYVLKYDIRNYHSAICKTHMFLIYSALDSSVWNLAALNVGRLIAVINPLKANLIFTQKRIWLAAFIITGCAMALNSHVFITRGKSYSSNSNCGYTSEEAENFWNVYLPYIVLLIYVLGPFVSFSICNSIIIFKVHHEIEGKCKSQASSQHQDSTVRSLTIMLVAASFTFLLLTTPNVILDFVRTTHADEPTVVGRAHIEGHLTWAVVDVICTLALYLNHSLSFYVYLLSGTRFRQEAALLFCPRLATRTSTGWASVHNDKLISHSGTEKESESRRQSLIAAHQPHIYDKEALECQAGQNLLDKDGDHNHHPKEELPPRDHAKNGRQSLRSLGHSVAIVIEPQRENNR